MTRDGIAVGIARWGLAVWSCLMLWPAPVAAQQWQVAAGPIRQWSPERISESGVAIDVFWRTWESASGDWSRGFVGEFHHLTPRHSLRPPLNRTTGAFGWRFIYAGFERAWNPGRTPSGRVTVFFQILLNPIPAGNHFRTGVGYGVQARVWNGLAIRYQADGYYVAEDAPFAGRRMIALVWQQR
jgi:hypothetical protein